MKQSRDVVKVAAGGLRTLPSNPDSCIGDTLGPTVLLQGTLSTERPTERAASLERTASILSGENSQPILLSLTWAGALHPMKIAFLAPDVDLARRTGEASHVTDLAGALSRVGNEVVLATARDGMGTDQGIEMITLPPGNTLRCVASLVTRLRDEPPDVIYERRGSPKISVALGFLLRRPFFVEINGLVEEEREAQGRGAGRVNFGALAKSTVRGGLLRRSGGVVTVTEGLKRALVERYSLRESAVHVVPNGVDLELFRPYEKASSRTRLGLPVAGILGVFVGNLVPWQGLGTLLAACPLIRANIPEWHLLIVGDGVERVRLESEARDLGAAHYVTFAGSVPRSEVPHWIAASDLAFCTKGGNFQSIASPLKLREYLACGRPVVATALGGSEPDVALSGAGRVVPPDDTRALEEATLLILSDDRLAAEMGRMGRAFAEEHLSWNTVALRLTDMFRRTLAG